MRKTVGLLSVVMLLAAIALAAPDVPGKSQPFPQSLANARYVYVTSYDGGELNPSLLPEDRAAIADVQNALKQWGRYIVVYRPEQADMILAVQSRGSEDVLAAYDSRLGGSTYLWRAMARGGLDQNEMPLFGSFRTAVENASK